MTAPRILVTGSRAWTDGGLIARALFGAVESLSDREGRIVLVHGGARGADSIAHQIWLRGFWRQRMIPADLAQPEVHPADWVRYGRAAGHRRNAEMVALGADICLAFPLGDSPGTRGCVALAEKAGIPVVVHEGATK